MRNIRFYILVAIIIFISNFSYAKIHITVTNSYLKNLITAIGGNKISIDSLMNGGSCIHHYSFKPTELKKIINTDLLIYIDKNYETFIDKIIPLIQRNAQILEISSIKNIKYNNSVPLGYVWYDLQNIELILYEITHLLSKISPNDKAYFQKNYQENLEYATLLKQDLTDALGLIKKAIVIDDKLSYIFPNSNNIKNLFFHSHSLKFSDLVLLNKLTTEDDTQNICLFVTPESRMINNIRNDIKIIKINLDSKTTWYKQFRSTINQISTCRN